jgi:hypothetical protein
MGSCAVVAAGAEEGRMTDVEVVDLGSMMKKSAAGAGIAERDKPEQRYMRGTIAVVVEADD